MLLAAAPRAGATGKPDFQPRAGDEQLPRAMRRAMPVEPHVTVGLRGADIVGNDNRALQAAVDYIAGLGGGIVDIGPGVYLMRDSLHLRSHVTVRGVRGKTILRKARAVLSPLAVDGDYGEEQVTLLHPEGFDVGCGIAVWNSRACGFSTTVARIIGRQGNTLALDTPLQTDCVAYNSASAATIFPVVSGCYIVGARVENLVIDGDKNENFELDGCRGGGIYLYRGFGTVIESCVVRNYHGDGISFQQSNDVTIERCISENNAELGIHPGSGSERPVVRECVVRGNGEEGLYLCWRVRYGLFEQNLVENNGRYGISIGHKDSDNLLQHNEIKANLLGGVFFRNEPAGMAADRNLLEDNWIENNGLKEDTAAVRVGGETRGLIFRRNIIRDTRPPTARRQTVGIRIENQAADVVLDHNQIDAKIQLQDQRTPHR